MEGHRIGGGRGGTGEGRDLGTGKEACATEGEGTGNDKSPRDMKQPQGARRRGSPQATHAETGPDVPRREPWVEHHHRARGPRITLRAPAVVERGGVGGSQEDEVVVLLNRPTVCGCRHARVQHSLSAGASWGPTPTTTTRPPRHPPPMQPCPAAVDNLGIFQATPCTLAVPVPVPVPVAHLSWPTRQTRGPATRLPASPRRPCPGTAHAPCVPASLATGRRGIDA